MSAPGATAPTGAAGPKGGRAQPSISRSRLTALVARREFLRTVRRRGYIFGTLLLPIGIGLLMGISMFFSSGRFGETGSPSGTVVVVNASDVPITGFSSPAATLETLSADEAASQLAAGTINGYYLIPADFLQTGQVTRVESGSGTSLARLGGQQNSEALLRYVVSQALLRQAGVPEADASRILRGVTVSVETVGGEAVSEADMVAGILTPMAFVIIFMISIFMTSGYLLQSVTEEKENRVVEILLSSIPATPLMGGKIVGLGGAGLTQVAIWVISALIAIPVISSQIPDLGSIPIDPVMVGLALVYFVLGYLAFGAIFATIGAMAPGSREAQQYSGVLGFVAAIPLIVFSAYVTDLHSPLVVALSLFPLTAPTSMLLVMGLSDSMPWLLVGASLTSVALFAILATWAAARIFRATVLLYGVRPSLGQLVGAVRAPR
jgi:ABC-2 type transport system permease protein